MVLFASILFCIMAIVVFNRLTYFFFFFYQFLGYAQLFQVFWRAALLQLPYGCLGNAIRWAKSSRHRPTWAAMPRQAPLENAQNGLQQPKQVIFCSFPFPVIFLVSGGFQFFSWNLNVHCHFSSQRWIAYVEFQFFFREIATFIYRLLSFNDFFSSTAWPKRRL